MYQEAGMKYMTATLADPYILHAPCKDKYHGKWGGACYQGWGPSGIEICD